MTFIFSLIALLSLFLFFVPFTEYRLKMGYPLFERIAGELPHRCFIESKAFFVDLAEIAELFFRPVTVSADYVEINFETVHEHPMPPK